MSLATQSTQANIVLSLNTVKDTTILLIKLDTYLKKLSCQYAYILHDKDINNEGVLKTPHIHLVIYACSKRKRFATYVNELSTSLNINTFAIQIDKLVNLEGSLQYLLHKNDIDKYQYDFKDIHTNINDDEFNIFMNTENQSLTLDRLVVIISTSNNKLEIMQKVGLNRYNQLRNTINDIINDLR